MIQIIEMKKTQIETLLTVLILLIHKSMDANSQMEIDSSISILNLIS